MLRITKTLLQSVLLIGLAVAVLSSPARRVTAADDRERVDTPNYQQAMQFNSQYLRQFVYDTAVTPHWIGKTDSFWYEYRTSTGKNYWRVNAKLGTKEPLFDRVKLGALLSEAVQKPLDAAVLPLQRITINDEGTKLKFVVDDFQYEYELLPEKLTKLGKAPAAAPTGFPGGQLSREELERRREEFQRQRDEQQRQQDEQRQDQDQQRQQQQQQDEQQQEQQQQQDNQQQDQQRTGRGGPPGAGGRTSDYRNFSPDRLMYVFAKNHNLYLVELKPEDIKKEDVKPEAEKKDDATKKEDATKKADEKSDETKTDGQKDTTKKEGDVKEDGKKSDEKKDDAKTDAKSDGKKDETKKDDAKKDESKTESQGDEKKADEKQGDKPTDPPQEQGRRGGPPDSASQENQVPIPRTDPKLDETAIQLTTDGAEDYSFAGGFGGFGRGGGTGQGTTPPTPPDRKTRPNVTWSKDSKSFYLTRTDSRGVQELWVINSLANPRPTLEKYKYPMPGEPAIRKSELYLFTRDSKKLARVTPKWKDENYQNLHFGKNGGDELRFVRRDRLLRHIEFCSLNVATGEAKCLIGEGFENANILATQYRYLDDTDEMIWWSERSGWGHFYLYDRNGTLKNAITSGPYRTSRIVDVDAKNRMLYFTANGREPNENIYFEHLYCVRLDGTGLALMDPGNATHRSTLSPSKQFMVDNCSRVDMAPKSILREASGKEIMTLEEADLSRLRDAGWRMPETFVVKAADGVTDLYGNMWKPFDFDPNKKYPIIANVYPGPQTEGTTHTFSSSGGTQQLAQVGFIVIQVGHRGGTPNRSKAYASYGYFNLRDYGLEDKKSAIEQLAARHPFIDLNRVGIYGHSGGGFMTAAALLQKPYNDFFKVGVSTSGNHDNNVYNNSWSERYHGLKEVAVVDEKTQTGQAAQSGGSGSGGTRGGQIRRGTGGQQQQQQRGSEGAWDSLQTEDEDSLDEAAFEELLALINPEWTPPPHLAAQWGGPTSHQAPRDDDFFSPSETPAIAQQEGQEKKDEVKKEEVKKEETEKKSDDKKSDEKKSDDTKTDEKKSDATKSDDKKKSTEEKKVEEKKTEEKKTKFEIKVPTNQELAANLKGHLLLIHGEIDNNVHPANTMRLVDALIKANKRFDMLVIPGKRHGYADYQPYVTQRSWEYFAEHLMNDKQSAADIYEKAPPGGTRR
jgi:dipeptidyl aminopeptidase/acylaminoacyl peptidase